MISGGRRCSFYKTKTKAATERKKVEKQLKRKRKKTGLIDMYNGGTMKISVGNSRTSRAWKIKEFSWREFVQSVLRQYERLKRCRNIVNFLKGQQDNISKMWADLSEVNFAAVLRRKDTVINRCLLTLDADYADEDFGEQIELFFNFKCLIYSTHKHTAQNPEIQAYYPSVTSCYGR